MTIDALIAQIEASLRLQGQREELQLLLQRLAFPLECPDRCSIDADQDTHTARILLVGRNGEQEYTVIVGICPICACIGQIKMDRYIMPCGHIMKDEKGLAIYEKTKYR